jgi:hypothetical protein
MGFAEHRNFDLRLAGLAGDTGLLVFGRLDLVGGSGKTRTQAFDRRRRGRTRERA